MASEPESISSARSFPQWMRSRGDNRIHDGIDGATPFSPPSHDESFFYVRYPVQETVTNKNVRCNTNGTNTTTHISDALKNVTSAGQVDLSKHTEPCRRFLKANISKQAVIKGKSPSVNDLYSIAVPGVRGQTKPHGTDDGFKGSGAACGSSIVKVAQQMVSGGYGSTNINRGFTVANFDEAVADEPPFTDQRQLPSSQLVLARGTPEPVSTTVIAAAAAARTLGRRGSKSLPASPLGSPKTMRKFQPNPYFTNAYSGGTSETTRGWFLTSLLGVQRELTPSGSVSSQIDEEPVDEAASVGGVRHHTKFAATILASVAAIDPTLKAKPSELREMNFWSPTSM